MNDPIASSYEVKKTHALMTALCTNTRRLEGTHHFTTTQSEDNVVGTPQVACGHLQLTQGLPWWFRGQETALQYQGLRPDRSLLAQWVKYLPAVQETKVRSLGWEDSLENEMATHSCSCLENPMDRGAWRATVHSVRAGHK